MNAALGTYPDYASKEAADATNMGRGKDNMRSEIRKQKMQRLF